MKLRFKDNSLRFRVTQSDLIKPIDMGRIQKTIFLGRDENSRLTYAMSINLCDLCNSALFRRLN